MTATDTRDKVARRLLKATADKSFDPRVDIDWDKPLEPDKFYLSEPHVSLFATPLWDRMSVEQRVELSKHESASWLSAGIAFEMQLDAFLLRHAFVRDPRSNHVRYALTEIEDECRHSLMFSHLLDRLGTPLYSYDPKLRRLVWAGQHVTSDVGAFIGTLIVEEFLDCAQRQIMRDDNVQPLVRDVCTIHVIEEARHVSYARSEIARRMPRVSKARLAALRHVTAFMAAGIYKMLVDPQVYRSVGLDPREALAAVDASEHRREFRRDLTARTFTFFDQVGLIGGRSAKVWRAWGHPA
jgi:hypothetical protein